MISPQWTRSFATLAECGSFTRAAERLGLTQAAVSQHVRQLEDRLGPLLLRRPRHIELTPAGEALLDYARELDGAERRLTLRLSDANAADGEIGLITPGSIGLALYPLLLDLQATLPGLTIRHRFAPDPEVREAVANRNYELGLVTIRPDDARLVATAFTEEPLELVTPATARVEGWADLVRLGFIDHPDGQAMAMRLFSRRFSRSLGLRDVPLRGFTNQIALILEPVARGLGFTVIPRYARQAFARQDLIRVVEHGPPVVDTVWLIHRAEWPLSARAVRALAFLRERMGAAAQDGS